MEVTIEPQEIQAKQEALNSGEIRGIWNDFVKFREEHEDLVMIIDARVEEQLLGVSGSDLEKAKTRAMLVIYGIYKADEMRIKRKPTFALEVHQVL